MSNKIWINEQYFIPVTDEGFVDTKWNEGTLGVVIQLVPKGHSPPRAIKIPKLTADTMRENGYVIWILEEEARYAVEASKNLVYGAALLGLHYTEEDLFRGERATDRYVPAREQDKHILFVSFNKGKQITPRILSCRRNGQSFSIFPKTAERDFLRFLHQIDNPQSKIHDEQQVQHASSSAGWERLRSLAKDGQREWVQSSYGLVDPIELGQFSAGTLADTFGVDYARRAWYVALPSIVFEWAECTLEEAISRGLTTNWKLLQHLELGEKILQGIGELHRKGFMHGDVRPANIMAVASPALPSNYRLADYGSFAKDIARVDNANFTGHTMLGPGVGRQRHSPFYASERRDSFESELADTAVILPLKGEESTPTGTQPALYYGVLLGWDADLRETQDRQIKSEYLAKITKEFEIDQKGKPSSDDVAPDEPRPGDRLRIRDFMFQIHSARRLDSGELLCFCDGRYAVIHNERVAVYAYENVIDELTSISLSSYVIYNQWSAATDIFGYGALLLYGLITVGFDNATATRGQRMRQLLNDFRKLVSKIDTQQFEDAIQHEIRLFATTLMDNFRVLQNDHAHELTKVKIIAGTHEMNLNDYARHCVEKIYALVPEARRLFVSLEENAAYFLLVMDFVLRCLRRGKASFCSTRCEPLRDAAWKKSLDALEELKTLVANQRLSGFVMPQLASVGADSVSSTSTREREALLGQIEKLQRDLDAAIALEVETDTRLKVAEKSIGEIRNELDAVRKKLNQAQKDLSAEQRASAPVREKLEVLVTSLRELSELANEIREVGYVVTNKDRVNLILKKLQKLDFG